MSFGCAAGNDPVHTPWVRTLQHQTSQLTFLDSHYSSGVSFGEFVVSGFSYNVLDLALPFFRDGDGNSLVKHSQFSEHCQIFVAYLHK